MQITDRAKDVIESGGEWISTIDLENLAVGLPKVATATGKIQKITLRKPFRPRRVATGHNGEDGRS